MTLLDKLTPQETVILSLVSKGWRNAKIAQELVISIRTVESHLHRIYSKLGVNSRTEATIYILQSPAALNPNLRSTLDDTSDHNRYA